MTNVRRALTPEQAAATLRKYVLLGHPGPPDLRDIVERAVVTGAALTSARLELWPLWLISPPFPE